MTQKRIAMAAGVAICALAAIIFVYLVSCGKRKEAQVLTGDDPKLKESVRKNNPKPRDHILPKQGKGSNGEETEGFDSKNTKIEDLFARLYAASNPEERGEAIADISRAWVLTDPDACYEWGMQLEGHYDRYVALMMIGEKLADSGNFAKLEQFINATPKGELADNLIKIRFSDIARHDMAQAIKFSKMLSSDGGIQSAAGSLSAVITMDYAEGDWWKIVNEIDNGLFRESLTYGIIKETASNDPLKAIQFFKDALPNSNEYIGYSMSVIADNFVRVDPENGIKSIASLINGKNADRFLSIAGSKWATIDSNRASEWMSRQINAGNYEDNKHVINGMVASLATQDFETLSNKIAEMSDDRIQEDLRFKALGMYSSIDPARVASEMQTMSSNGSTKSNQQISNVVSNWMKKNPSAASEWVKSLDSGVFRDSAIGPVINDMIKYGNDVDGALKWAASISDGRKRELEIDRLNSMR